MQGIMFADRLGGVLAVTRAFGDHSLSDQGLVCTPFVTRIELRVIHKWLIVASDGLWDVISPNVIIILILWK
jgi:serine/threonine protein phosphatase PrpC